MRPSPVRRRLIMGILGALAAGGIVFAFSAPTHKGETGGPAAVESVSPAGGDLDLRQITISADLAAGYTGYLAIDGVEVPADDQVFVDALNSVTLKPQPGSEYNQLAPGPHCATVFYRLIGQPREDSQSHTWCFRLH